MSVINSYTVSSLTSARSSPLWPSFIEGSGLPFLPLPIRGSLACLRQARASGAAHKRDSAPW